MAECVSQSGCVWDTEENCTTTCSELSATTEKDNFFSTIVKIGNASTWGNFIDTAITTDGSSIHCFFEKVNSQGVFGVGNYGDTLFVVKLDNSGNSLCYNSFGSSRMTAKAIAIDSNNSLVYGIQFYLQQ